jgi:hypothetical protein
MSLITLADLKQHLRLVPGNAEDDLLQAKIDSAEALVAGYIGSDDLATDFAPMPAPLLEAIRQWAGVLYENRTGEQAIPTGVAMLLANYRHWSFGCA